MLLLVAGLVLISGAAVREANLGPRKGRPKRRTNEPSGSWR